MELNTAEKRRSGFVGLWISFLGFGKSHEDFQKAYLNLKKILSWSLDIILSIIWIFFNFYSNPSKIQNDTQTQSPLISRN